MAGPVRQQIDQAALEEYVKDNVPEIVPPLELKQFGFGQSNVNLFDVVNHRLS